MPVSDKQPIDGSAAHSRRCSVEAQLFCLFNQTRGTTIAASISMADTPSKRRHGLLGRPSLLPSQGMWIVPCESVHTVAMRFPIDVVYLDKKRRVVKIVEAMAPYRVSLCLRARSVIELAAGTARRSGTQVGHQLLLAAHAQPMSAVSD